MRTAVRRLIASATVAAVLAALALPAIAFGTITGGCAATGTSTSGGTIDLAAATEWHVKSTDTISGTGTAPSPQTSASVGAYGLGLAIPIASGSGGGDTSGSVTGLAMSTFSLLGARFTMEGTSTGAGGGCSGQVLLVIDDVNPLLTVLGGGGAAVAAVGAVILLAAMRMGGGFGSRLVGLLFGLVGGAGLGLSLAQFGILDAASIVGLAVAVGGGVIGLVTPGLLHGSSAAMSA